MGQWGGKSTPTRFYAFVSLLFGICVGLANQFDLFWILCVPITWLILKIYIHVNFPSVEALYFDKDKSPEKSFEDYRFNVLVFQTTFTAFFFFLTFCFVYLLSLIF